MNSIAAYCMADLFEAFISKSLTTHLGKDVFNVLGAPYRAVAPRSEPCSWCSG